MARPSIPEERYEQAISQMLDEGTNLEQITATRLQSVVGGRYSRAAELLKAYQESHTNTQQADVPEKPEWFDGFQQALISQTDKLWSEIVSPEIQRRYDLAAKEAEKARHESELNRADDLKHITALEDHNEQQAEANDQLCKEISELKLQLASEQAKREQASEQHQKEIEQCQQQIAQLRAEDELAKVNQALNDERHKSAQAQAVSDQQEKRITELNSQIATLDQRHQEAVKDLSASKQQEARVTTKLELSHEQQQQDKNKILELQESNNQLQRDLDECLAKSDS